MVFTRDKRKPGHVGWLARLKNRLFRRGKKIATPELDPDGPPEPAVAYPKAAE
jgi:hypothetical protein